MKRGGWTESGAWAQPPASLSERSLKFSRILTEKAQLVVTLNPVARKSMGSRSPGFVPPVLDFALPCGMVAFLRVHRSDPSPLSPDSRPALPTPRCATDSRGPLLY